MKKKVGKLVPLVAALGIGLAALATPVHAQAQASAFVPSNAAQSAEGSGAEPMSAAIVANVVNYARVWLPVVGRQLLNAVNALNPACGNSVPQPNAPILVETALD